jgi:hypothetical protein
MRHIWKSTRLRELFPSALDILDEMRPIRMAEHTNRARFITPFVGAQVDICEEFGFDISEDCEPAYTPKQKPKQSGDARPKLWSRIVRTKKRKTQVDMIKQIRREKTQVRCDWGDISLSMIC